MGEESDPEPETGVVDKSDITTASQVMKTDIDTILSQITQASPRVTESDSDQSDKSCLSRLKRCCSRGSDRKKLSREICKIIMKSMKRHCQMACREGALAIYAIARAYVLGKGFYHVAQDIYTHFEPTLDLEPELVDP